MSYPLHSYFRASLGFNEARRVYNKADRPSPGVQGVAEQAEGGLKGLIVRARHVVQGALTAMRDVAAKVSLAGKLRTAGIMGVTAMGLGCEEGQNEDLTEMGGDASTDSTGGESGEGDSESGTPTDIPEGTDSTSTDETSGSESDTSMESETSSGTTETTDTGDTSTTGAELPASIEDVQVNCVKHPSGDYYVCNKVSDPTAEITFRIVNGLNCSATSNHGFIELVNGETCEDMGDGYWKVRLNSNGYEGMIDATIDFGNDGQSLESGTGIVKVEFV